MHVKGLSSSEVASLSKAGKVNDFEPQPTSSIPVIILRNVFIIFNLLLAPLLTVLFIVGQLKDVLSVGGIAMLNTLINIIQEIRAKRALDRIKMENPPMALVIRDGERRNVPTRTIVEGDYLLLKPGELALADGALVEARNLEVDESMLTGESDYIPKGKGDTVLSGSYAVAGEGIYRAEKIGAESYMQQVVESSRKPSSRVTPLEKKVNLLVNSFMVSCFIVATILLIKFKPFAGESVAVDPIRYIVASVTTLIPQGLVLMVTLTFALGVVAFAKRGIIFQRINAVESLSNVSVICMDKTGTLTHNHIEMKKLRPLGEKAKPELRQLLSDFANGVGDQNKTMAAVQEAFSLNKKWMAVEEIPFKSRNKYSAIRLEHTESGERLDCLLGAYEMVKPFLEDHDEDAAGKITGQIERQERKGQRSMVLAFAPAKKKPLKESLSGMRLEALLAFEEAIKQEAPDILAGLSRRGVKQVIISGDSLITVQSIAARIGFQETEKGVSGQMLEDLSGEELRRKVLDSRIFARISPEQKQMIIRTFKEEGEYTAMVGDGVNDVLALKEANFAVAMGSGGSMAKDVADVVLVDNRFSVIPDLLDEGDRIISRIQDCARIFTLKNFYALFMTISVLILGITFPFYPQQITLINMLTIGVPVLYLVNFSRYKARVAESFLKDILRFSISFGLLVAVTALSVNYLYTFLLESGQFMVPDQWIEIYGQYAADRYAQTAAILPTIAQAFFAYLYLLNRARTPRQLLGDRRMALLGVILLGFFPAAMYVPLFRSFFELIPFQGRDWLISGAFALVALMIQYVMMRFYIQRLGQEHSNQNALSEMSEMSELSERPERHEESEKP